MTIFKPIFLWLTIASLAPTSGMPTHEISELKPLSVSADTPPHPARPLDYRIHPEFMCPFPVIYFDVGSAVLTAEGKTEIADVIPKMKAHCGGLMVITGHSDVTETTPDDTRLSMQRANNVADALVAEGFKRDKLQIRWVGDRDPAVNSKNAEPLNRRVTVESPQSAF